MIAALSALSGPRALVSIVAKHALAMRPALERDWAAALASFETDRQVNGLGVETRGDSVEGLSAMLALHHVDPIAWYGVRLFADGWVSGSPDAAQDADPEDLVFAVELEASRRDPYRQVSRLFHLVGRRHPDRWE